MGKFFLCRLLFVAFTGLALAACNNNTTILVGATTTLEDSGILARLIDAFEQQYNITVKPVIAGSGQIHELIVRGDIDTAITHDPIGEKRLLENKVIHSRKPLMRNDFLIVGPKDDPAQIRQSATPAGAFAKIINSGQTLVSRNDQSGTHQMEQRWLKKAGPVTNGEKIIRTGTGMGNSLAVAAEKQAYILVDRGTWLHFSGKQGLDVLFEDIRLLPNDYSILFFDNNSAGDNKAEIWEQWLQSRAARDIIMQYQINNQSVFFESQNHHVDQHTFHQSSRRNTKGTLGCQYSNHF